MIDKIYNKYFQKSKSFLYPALGIKKSNFGPENTYLSIEGLIPAEDMKLICVFKNTESEKFKKFEEDNITTNPLYVKTITVDDKKFYVFDMYVYKNDWLYFMLGRYSKFSNVLKKAIRVYFGEGSAEYKYIDTYLHPKEYFAEYAKILQIDEEIIINVGELCNPCDKEKENLKIPIENLESLEKTN